MKKRYRRLRLQGPSVGGVIWDSGRVPLRVECLGFAEHGLELPAVLFRGLLCGLWDRPEVKFYLVGFTVRTVLYAFNLAEKHLAALERCS